MRTSDGCHHVAISFAGNALLGRNVIVLWAYPRSLRWRADEFELKTEVERESREKNTQRP